MLDDFEKRMASHGGAQAIISGDKITTYDELTQLITEWKQRVEDWQIPAGAVVALIGDYDGPSIAAFWALTRKGCIVAPLTSSVEQKFSEFFRIAEIQYVIDLRNEKNELKHFEAEVTHALLMDIKAMETAGLILFSSGSTGDSKAAVHDFLKIAIRYEKPGKALRSIAFLLFDHIGGVNTLLYTLVNGGCLITSPQRQPDEVFSQIEKYQVDCLPTSPTFLNMMLLSRSYEKYDYSSLKVVTYGSEPMPQNTLDQVSKLFTDIKLKQTYGMSEIGILKSQSESSDSLWLKLGGGDAEVRVVDGILQVKSQSAMLGYLNAPSPFTDDGWMITGDRVEVKGEYFRFLGRESEMINVGGQKVFPLEIENHLIALPEIEEVIVYSTPNMLTGQSVAVKVKPAVEIEARELKKLIRKHCTLNMERFMVPTLIVIEEEMVGDRLKKKRG